MVDYGKTVKDRWDAIDDAGESHDEIHEPGTPRGEARGCFVIDPVTKKPKDAGCDEPGAIEK